MKKIFHSETCIACEKGKWIPFSDGVYCFRGAGKEHKVSGMHYAVCNKCGQRGNLPGQSMVNHKIIKTFESQIDGYISPQVILSIRQKYGLTQKNATKIFGGGSQAFSKWERGIVSPTLSASKLLRLVLKNPQNLYDLAKEAGVELNKVICNRDEDKQKLKIKKFRIVYTNRVKLDAALSIESDSTTIPDDKWCWVGPELMQANGI